MSSILNIGISGLNAAQVALSTVSNNIANASSSGYSEESVLQAETIGQSNGQYTIGSGVNVTAVQRAYSQYLTQAVWSGNSSLQNATTNNNLTSALNGFLSNSGNLQTSLDNLYSSFSSVANSPTSSSVRQAALGSASSLTSVFNTLGQQLSTQSTQVNQQIGGTVTSINNLASQIAKLNNQILQAGSTGNPNALLDQRDSLVQQLAGLTGISASTSNDGSVSVYTSAGGTLVSGAQSYALSSGANQYDPGSTDVYDSAGNDITSQLSGGTLGALLSYRDTVLAPAQNALGQSAIALASSVNGQQAAGLNLNGQQGQAIFSVGSPSVLPSNKNSTGGATITASVSDVSQLTTSDYLLRYTGTGTGTNGWTLSTTSGQNVALTANANGTLSANGLTFSVSGTAQTGDSYEIEPTRNASTSLSVVMTDPNGIAAAAALTASAGTSNTGTGKAGSVSVTNSANSNLLSGATVTFGAGGNYTIVDGAGNTTTGTYTAGQPITADGWSMSLTGTPASGDTFAVSANTNGLNDNSNALSLAALSDTGVTNGGKTSVIASYANLTAQIGSAGSLASADLTTQTNIYNQAMSTQQSYAGVNMNQEAANLVQFQQAYQASAQVITTAEQIFSSLITAIQYG
ncbi:flagellar hook-associated protein FlgK [Dyella nitratireducens]|uniref:Flagellar hook-associated protein 1 n=1 Tax=Dyella nitratireducens TaxID=1849580 RepID=A0ABQ1FRR2_9GAMM|nr:flagellar hook-associated protein FlgK [Dyella nitratireducens]GGA27734.1 flagellar hook-associated protein FlgK [Dyella nitratireducens]GLQ43374.1 flagellar hook-associated protein FlgK [Dyella nitratireducens]